MKIQGQLPIPIQDKVLNSTREKEAPEQKNAILKEETPRSLKKDFTVNRVRQKIEAEPDMNMEKVNELKARIKSGKYQVDAEKLAGNLLKDSLFEDLNQQS